jgi:hypothetical protein
LNPWEYSVQLGHRYGVKVYPSLDESRVRDEAARELRGSLATYRGRALNVWSSGADGVYLFNLFDPQSPLWRELGDPAALRKLERNYFASVRGVGSMPVPHQKFMHVPTLNPANPIAVEPHKTARVEFRVGENLGVNNEHQRVNLRLLFKPPPEPEPLSTVLNQRQLAVGHVRAGWLEFDLPDSLLREGVNILELSCDQQGITAISLMDLYVAIIPY